MKQSMIFISCLFSFLSCANNVSIKENQISFEQIEQIDTLLNNKTIEYFVKEKNIDKSYYFCSVTKWANKRTISINMDNKPYYRKSIIFKKRLQYLELLLGCIYTDLQIENCSSIFLKLGLLSSGDMAIDITNLYQKEYGHNITNDYLSVGNIIQNSIYVQNINSIFIPFDFTVSKIYVEKLFFSQKKSLIKASEIETDLDSVPNEVLDCSIVVELTKKIK
jgi:hypothetical protein